MADDPFPIPRPERSDRRSASRRSELKAPATVGVDLGGTKVLVGVVGANREVLYEDREGSAGQTGEELLNTLEREIRKALDAHPGAAAVGLGIPCTIDRERGIAITAVNLPIRNLPIRDEMRARLGVSGLRRQRRQRRGARRAPLRRRQGHQRRGDADDRHRDRRWGDHRRGALPGSDRGGQRARPHGDRLRRTALPGQLPQPRLPGDLRLRYRTGRARARPPRSASRTRRWGTALAEGEKIDGKAVTDAANDGDPAAVAVVAEAGRRLGAGSVGPRQHLRARGDRDRRRRGEGDR